MIALLVGESWKHRHAGAGVCGCSSDAMISASSHRLSEKVGGGGVVDALSWMSEQWFEQSSSLMQVVVFSEVRIWGLSRVEFVFSGSSVFMEQASRTMLDATIAEVRVVLIMARGVSNYRASAGFSFKMV